jgi:hypothetical protein
MVSELPAHKKATNSFVADLEAVPKFALELK